VEKKLREVKLSEIKTDPVGDELTKSAKMKPYIDYYVAAMNKKGVEAAVRRVADLELKDRYLWRVASALQWAFGDFDGETAKLDWQFMSEEQRRGVGDVEASTHSTDLLGSGPLREGRSRPASSRGRRTPRLEADQGLVNAFLNALGE
jgi:hypothetical protein